MVQDMEDPAPILVPCAFRLFPDPSQVIRLDMQTFKHVLIWIDPTVTSDDLTALLTTDLSSQNLAS